MQNTKSYHETFKSKMEKETPDEMEMAEKKNAGC
jgi:hypothetical protein